MGYHGVMKTTRFHERLKTILEDLRDPSVLALGPEDSDLVLEIMESVEVSRLETSNTGHYTDSTLDLILYYTGFDKLTHFSKDCIVRGALRVLRPGGYLILRTGAQDQDISKFKEYLFNLNSHLAMITPESNMVIMEIRKDESES